MRCILELHNLKSILPGMSQKLTTQYTSKLKVNRFELFAKDESQPVKTVSIDFFLDDKEIEDEEIAGYRVTVMKPNCLKSDKLYNDVRITMVIVGQMVTFVRKRIRDIEKKNIYLKKIEISNYYILINRDLEIMM